MSQEKGSVGRHVGPVILEASDLEPHSGPIERDNGVPSGWVARLAAIDAEIAGAHLCRAAYLLSRVIAGTSSSARAVAAGEARDAYEAALRRMERVRGTSRERQLHAMEGEVRSMLELEEAAQTWPP